MNETDITISMYSIQFIYCENDGNCEEQQLKNGFYFNNSPLDVNIN